MKVKPKDIEKWELEVECEDCTKTLILESADDLREQEFFIGGFPNYYYFCICPECGNKIEVPAGHIREDVKAKVKTVH